MKKLFLFLFLSIIYISSISTAFAVSDSVLAELLVQKGIISENELHLLQEEINYTSQIKTSEEISSLLDETLPAWINKIRWYGDLRVRYENRDSNNTIETDQYSFRARYGFIAKINDKMEMGIRVNTGSALDPATAEQSMDGAFADKTLVLDLAYIKYMPLDLMSLWFGKFQNPFFSTDLIFDEDLTFEGFAQKFEFENDYADFYFTLGQFPLEFDNTNANNAWLFSAQLGMLFCPLEEVDMNFAIATHKYKNIFNKALTGIETPVTYLGNTTDINGNYISNYDLFNITGKIDFEIDEIPFRIVGDYVKNSKVEGALVNSSEDSGYKIGLTVGRALKPNTLEGYIYYKKLEAEATLGIFSDSDFGAGGTNNAGYVTGLKYQLLENTQLGLKYMSTEEAFDPAGNKDENDAFQLDMNVKF